MRIKERMVYETEDGTFHETRMDSEKHLLEQQMAKLIVEYLNNDIRNDLSEVTANICSIEITRLILKEFIVKEHPLTRSLNEVAHE